MSWRSGEEGRVVVVGGYVTVVEHSGTKNDTCRVLGVARAVRGCVEVRVWCCWGVVEVLSRSA